GGCCCCFYEVRNDSKKGGWKHSVLQDYGTLADQITDEQFAEIKEAYSQFHVDEKGISTYLFAIAKRYLNLTTTDEDFAGIRHGYAADRKCTMLFPEFLTRVARVMKRLEDAERMVDEEVHHD
ncbi:hypothetical protein LSAT2_004031, partial [Lamellibrachia satsuma]